jgi:hypothetical protein
LTAAALGFLDNFHVRPWYRTSPIIELSISKSLICGKFEIMCSYCEIFYGVVQKSVRYWRFLWLSEIIVSFHYDWWAYSPSSSIHLLKL